MRALSSKTELFDPYRAGYALGEKLAPLSPEVIFLFSSIHYATQELLEGLYDALGTDETVVIGNSGGGIYETAGITNQGAAALGLNSYGKVTWKLSCIEDVDQNLAEKLQQLGDAQRAEGVKPTLAYLAADFRIDAQELEHFILHHICYPVVGGLADDDLQRRSCRLYANRCVLQNALVLLAAYGELNFSTAVGNDLRHIGHRAQVDKVEGKHLCQIDGIPASQFIERETGSPLLHSDFATVLLRVSDPQTLEIRRLRSIIPDEQATTTDKLHLICGIPTGSEVQVCLADTAELLDSVEQIAEREKASGNQPVAALIVSCTGRKHALGKKIHHEVDALTDRFPGLPLVGFPSHGEIAPLRQSNSRCTHNFFHNMTYVLLLIGP